MTVKVWPWTVIYPKLGGTPYWLRPRDPEVEARHVSIMRKMEAALPADAKRGKLGTEGSQ